MFLDTATNQPEAIAFYLSLGYREVRRHTQPEWSRARVSAGNERAMSGATASHKRPPGHAGSPAR